MYALQTNAQGKTINKIMWLPKGSVTPYEGALMEKQDLIQFMKDAELKDIYSEKLAKDCMPRVEAEFAHDTWYIGLGMVLGAGIIWFTTH